MHRADVTCPAYTRAAPELGVGRLELGQDPARADDQQLAGVGQRHPPRGALDERQAELVLEPADLLGQRGLGDVLALPPRG